MHSSQVYIYVLLIRKAYSEALSRHFRRFKATLGDLSKIGKKNIATLGDL